MTTGHLFWFYRQGETPEQDGYRRATKATAAFLQADGTEVWPVISSDPERDYQNWVRTDGEDRRLRR